MASEETWTGQGCLQFLGRPVETLQEAAAQKSQLPFYCEQAGAAFSTARKEMKRIRDTDLRYPETSCMQDAQPCWVMGRSFSSISQLQVPTDWGHMTYNVDVSVSISRERAPECAAITVCVLTVHLRVGGAGSLLCPGFHGKWKRATAVSSTHCRSEVGMDLRRAS